MHEIDLSKYSIRTDLAIDSIESVNENFGIDQKELIIENIKVNRVKLDKKNSLNKKQGNYTTISFDDITDSENGEKVKKVLIDELKVFLKKECLQKEDLILIVGLGNARSTPDSLGTKVVDEVLVTNHLYILNELDDGFSRVAVFLPGVMGTTGLETSAVIKSIVEKLDPKLVIVIDSLASSSLDRVNRTIQLTDTGIHPGSGVGNSRKEVSEDVLHVPVLAIGVPTVVEATTIVVDTINYMYKHYAFHKKNSENGLSKLMIGPVNYLSSRVNITDSVKEDLFGLIGKLNNREFKSLIYEVLKPIGFDMMVTPKEVDFTVVKLAKIIASALNCSLHPSFNFIDKN